MKKVTYCNKMFEFVKILFFDRISIFIDFNKRKFIELYSMNNQECRPEIVNRDDPEFYSFSIKTRKCSGSCSNINNPYAKIWFPDVV